MEGKGGHPRYGGGTRTVRLSPETVAALRGVESGRRGTADALRFLGAFMAFHLDLPTDVRRLVARALDHADVP